MVRKCDMTQYEGTDSKTVTVCYTKQYKGTKSKTNMAKHFRGKQPQSKSKIVKKNMTKTTAKKERHTFTDQQKKDLLHQCVLSGDLSATAQEADIIPRQLRTWNTQFSIYLREHQKRCPISKIGGQKNDGPNIIVKVKKTPYSLKGLTNSH